MFLQTPFWVILPWLGGHVLAQVPTLTYNCAKMPAICQNVNSKNPLLGVPGVAGALGDLDPGRTPNGLPYLQLDYDTTPGASKDRRALVCPENWKSKHACPETNQPPIVPQEGSWADGWHGVRWNPNGLLFGQSGYNSIANEFGTAASGMIWTCDEWPPAVYVIIPKFAFLDHSILHICYKYLS
jgi:hypothetical protein